MRQVVCDIVLQGRRIWLFMLPKVGYVLIISLFVCHGDWSA